jgi:hypothetical protein
MAAPTDAGALDHEGETYRLWRALGARGEKLLTTTDLGRSPRRDVTGRARRGVDGLL